MKLLPTFKPRTYDTVLEFMSRVLMPDPTTGKSHLVKLIEYADGHYRAVFSPAYFVLPAGQLEPSKSQWNNLKKRMKRHEPLVFVFKEHGETNAPSGGKYYFVDFGFFAN
ncbi:MAG: hypothetical protein R3E39_20370 [Anaerolineae bacterium]